MLDILLAGHLLCLPPAPAHVPVESPAETRPMRMQRPYWVKAHLRSIGLRLGNMHLQQGSPCGNEAKINALPIETLGGPFGNKGWAC